MSYITVGFSHDPSDWISRVMAWLTHARYTHAVMFNPSDLSQAIEASGVGSPKGVRYISLDEFMRKPNATARRISCKNPELVWELAASKIGNGYDWMYLLGWLTRRNLQDSERWVCHELIAWAAHAAGSPLLDMSDAIWLTPEHLYLISKGSSDACI